MFKRAAHLTYADIPIVYVLELGGEEYIGLRDAAGNFTPTALDAVPKEDWQQVEMFGPSLGLLIPCIAEFVDANDEPAGGLTVRVIGERPACATIYSYTQGLTSSLLRQIPVSTLVREAIIPNTVRVLKSGNQFFGARYVEGGLGFGQLHDDLQRELATVDEVARRRILNDDFLKMVAHIYRTALRLGLAPAKHVESMLGPTTPANARRWIAAARTRGFLGPAPAVGRAGELIHEEAVSS